MEILFAEFKDFIYPEIISSAESIFNYLSSLFLVFKDNISRDTFFEIRNTKSPPTPDYKSNSNKKDLRLEVNLLHSKVKKLILDNKPKFIDVDPNSFLQFETYQAFLDENPEYSRLINNIQMYNLKKMYFIKDRIRSEKNDDLKKLKKRVTKKFSPKKKKLCWENIFTMY